jgi:hypothetical protein
MYRRLTPFIVALVLERTNWRAALMSDTAQAEFIPWSLEKHWSTLRTPMLNQIDLSCRKETELEESPLFL